MADVKLRLEQRLIRVPAIQKLFPEGVDFDENKHKFLRVHIQRDVQGDDYDVFNVTIRIQSTDMIKESIHINTLIKVFLKLEDKQVIRKVIPNGYDLVSSELALYNYADVRFIVVTSIERE